MTNTDPIDFTDLQGLVRFAHAPLQEASFLLLTVSNAKAARSWLRTAPVTTAAGKSPPAQALQVAFTAPGLRALEINESVIEGFSEEFITGMVGDDSRSRRLGDVGNNHPNDWDWGGSKADSPHLVLMLYAHTDSLNTWQNEIMDAAFTRAFELQSLLKTSTLSPREPFGFVDGISQPETDWQRSVSTDSHQRDTYSNLLALGEVLLGYPNEYGLYTSRPLIDPKLSASAQQLPIAEDQPTLRDLGCNGTYLVIRQLAQDVPGFWQFLDREAKANVADREQLAAAMIGRQRDGTPLVSALHKPLEKNDDHEPLTQSNAFTFDGDPHGQRCPIGAHIRRSNPRTGDFPPGVTGFFSRMIRTLGFGRRHAHDDLIASTRFHRILRRGRAYGSTLLPEDAVKSDAPNDERGLQFICLGANISRQFEFVQNAWAMSAKFAGLASENDPVLGNREPLRGGQNTDQFSIPLANEPSRCVKGLPQFVTVRGGAYFFMPGIKALRFIVSEPSESTTQ